jgi:hypothetical protein
MRVCQPGPVAFHLASTVSGKRIVTWRRGLVATGRPARLTTPRLSMESVSSGRSAYSLAFVLCESMRLRSDFKVWADTGLLAFIGFSHAENMAHCSSWRIADDDQATSEIAEANHARFAIILTGVLDLESDTSEDDWRIFEVEATLIKRLFSLGRIVANAHDIV